MVVDEHKALIKAYRHELILKDGINVLTKKSSFIEVWSLFKIHFPNLNDYCGIVVTLFLKTSTIESKFFVLHREKDEFRKVLFNFGLEGVLWMKQYLFIKQLLESN